MALQLATARALYLYINESTRTREKRREEESEEFRDLYRNCKNLFDLLSPLLDRYKFNNSNLLCQMIVQFRLDLIRKALEDKVLRDNESTVNHDNRV